MFVPDIVSSNVLSVYHSKFVPKTKRCLKSEDFSGWCKNQVKTLRKLCLNTIVTNWRQLRIINILSMDEDARYVLDNLPTDLPFDVSIFHIHDDLYWQRAFKKRWPGKMLPTKPVKLDYDIPNQFDRTRDPDDQRHIVKINTWKCFFIERHLQDFLEHLKPENYNPEQILDKLGEKTLYTPQIANVCASLRVTAFFSEFGTTITQHLHTSLLTSMKELIELSRDYIIRLKLNQLQAPFDHNKERIPLQVILPALANLKQLNICFKQTYVGNDFSWHVLQTTKKDIENLSKGLEQCHLEVLRIINTDITCDKVTLIACHLVANKNLRVLDFSHCKIGDKGTIAICKLLQELPNLEELNLMNNFIEVKGLEVLCFTLCKNNVKLKQLDLNLNNFGETGANFLARVLVENTQLARLNISACGLTTDNVELLIKALQTNKSMLSLDLSNNRLNEKIGNLIIDVLKWSNYSLTSVDLRMTWIPSNILLEIEEMLHDPKRKSLGKEIKPTEKCIAKIKNGNMICKKTENDSVDGFPIFHNANDIEAQFDSVFKCSNTM